MLILAGVSISDLSNNGGIINRSILATKEFKKQNLIEVVKTAEIYVEMDNQFDRTKQIDIVSLINKVKEISDIDEKDYIITVDEVEQKATIIDKKMKIVIDIWIDARGNVTVDGNIVDNIEAIVAPTIEYTLAPPAGTYGEEVTITIVAKESKNGIVKTQFQNNAEKTYSNKKEVTETYTVTENGTYTFTAEGANGRKANKYIEINRVDTTAPSTATIASSNVDVETFTLTATGADGQSGVAKYEFYINDILEETVTTTAGTATYNVTGKTGSTTYTCYVKVYDAVGKFKTSSSITVTTNSAIEPMDIALFDARESDYVFELRLDLYNRTQPEISNIQWYFKYTTDDDSSYQFIEEGLNFNPSWYGDKWFSSTEKYGCFKAIVTDIYGYSTEVTVTAYMSCFLAGTQVLTEKGLKNIEDIVVGENVWTLNMDNNQRELKPVLDVIHSQTNAIFELTIGDELIKCTPRHQFYVQDKGWIRAYDLKEGDRIVSKDDNSQIINKINYVYYGEEILPTYNLTVEGNHNYLITGNEILVHNIPSSLGGVVEV